MPHETRPLREVRLADVALVRTQAGVAQYVCAQGHLGKRLAAYLALVCIVLMHAPVTRHLDGSFALLTAVLTLENLLVHQQVIVQFGLVRELFRAEVTSKFVLLPQMLPHVTLKILHRPAANVANVPVGRVRVTDMHEDVGFESGLFAAVIADVLLLFRAVRADLMSL